LCRQQSNPVSFALFLNHHDEYEFQFSEGSFGRHISSICDRALLARRRRRKRGHLTLRHRAILALVDRALNGQCHVGPSCESPTFQNVQGGLDECEAHHILPPVHSHKKRCGEQCCALGQHIPLPCSYYLTHFSVLSFLSLVKESNSSWKKTLALLPRFPLQLLRVRFVSRVCLQAFIPSAMFNECVLTSSPHLWFDDHVSLSQI
jgi:hypothetical protein